MEPLTGDPEGPLAADCGMVTRAAEQPTSPSGLVILDCDGVLVDSERVAVKVDVQVFARSD